MTRRNIRQAGVAAITSLALIFGAAACSPGDEKNDVPGWEVWALDQGTNKLYVIDEALEVVETVDLSAHLTRPHMIDFTSDYRYGFIANTVSGNVAVIRASDRKVVKVIETGPASHMAAVLPDDSGVIVAVMGAGKLVEITIDQENEAFEIGRTLTIADDPVFQERELEFENSNPVCHAYTRDGKYAYVTLGPSLPAGGVVVLDTQSFSLVKAYPQTEVAANCGTMLSPDGTKMFVNGGSLEHGHWYVFDTATHEVIHDDSSRGFDAHGLFLTPAGDELWMVNRATSNAIIVDPESFEVKDEMEFVGQSPDILTITPDGRYALITLRGPTPLSGPHAIAGDTPGVSVVDIAGRTIARTIEPDAGNEESDFHGIALRLLK